MSHHDSVRGMKKVVDEKHGSSEEEIVSEQLEQVRHQLLEAQRLASLGARVAGVAHEINTPVGNSVTVSSTLTHRIESFRQRVESGELRRSELAEFLDDLDEACRLLNRNLASAAERVRAFKQVAVDQVSAQRRSFDLRRVVVDVLETHRPQLRNVDVQVTLEIPDNIELNSYPGALGQVISNCFNNALVHGFDGRNNGRIKVRAVELGAEEVLVEVVDDGRGMTPEQREHAFDRFFTTRASRGGSGLGLTIVRSIVCDLLRGSVELESSPDAGTRVKIRIPRSPDDDQETGHGETGKIQ
jgi:two-component system, NtrC family, sensor kinase